MDEQILSAAEVFSNKSTYVCSPLYTLIRFYKPNSQFKYDQNTSIYDLLIMASIVLKTMSNFSLQNPEIDVQSTLKNWNQEKQEHKQQGQGT